MAIYTNEPVLAHESDSMHIMLVTENFLPKVDGIVTRNCRVAAQLVKRGCRLTIVCPENGLTSYEGATISGRPAIPLPFYPERHVMVGRIALGMAKRRPDVIHIANPITMARPPVQANNQTHRLGIMSSLLWNDVSFARRCSLYAKRTHIPLVTSFHTDYLGYLDHFRLAAWRPFLLKVHARYCKLSDQVLCVSHWVTKELQRQGLSAIRHYPSGVDSERFHPNKRSEAMRFRLTDGEPNKPLVICVSRLSKEKGLEDLRVLFNKIPDLRLALIGDGPQKAFLQQHFADTPTTFPGYLGGEELAQAYASSDLMAFPSPNEAFGLVLLEAMASGLVVVAANKCGIPDVIAHGNNGYLYDTVDQLTAYVAYALGDQHLKRRARQFAEANPWEQVGTQLLSIYRDAVAHAAAKRLS